ncbi:MAG: (Fe-S)-binding protein [Dehalococcoidia bacterium]|nr:(Fe-S)-binding protein [Dehalococcoidia bacterium]
MTSKSYIEAFDPQCKSSNICANCGICLQKCPIMRMDRPESLSEMASLLSGTETRRVLNECTFCFSCNHYCPHGLKPYALIMERMAEKIRRQGKVIPPYIDYYMTGKGDSNIFCDVYDSLPQNDQEILNKWAAVPPKSKEVLFVGCTGRQIPAEIASSSVLAELPKYGPRTACCGELAYRFMDYKSFAETVERTGQLLAGLDTERLVCYCGSCANFLGNIWPNYHGVKLPFEIMSIWEWLWEKLQKGDLTVKRKISKKVAVSDSCYSSELGDEFFDAIRGLLKAAGMEVVELKNNLYDNLTCGMVSMVRNNFDYMEGVKEAVKKIAQIKESGAGDVACYCPGCFGQLRAGGQKAGLKVHYSLEEILWALGDEYTVPLETRVVQQAELFKQKVMSYFNSLNQG